MNNDDRTFIQDRIDELHLLGNQANQRIEKLSQQQQSFMSGSQQLFAEMTIQADMVKGSVVQLEHLAKKVEQNLAISQNRVRQSFYAIGAAALAVGLLVVVAIGLEHYYGDKIGDKRSELQLVEQKLRHKPLVIHEKDKDYIRIVPDTVVDLTDDWGNNKGTFAEVKYVH